MRTQQLPNAPGLETYGNGRNATAVVLSAPNGDTLKLWYSYVTCVAFAFNGARTVAENVWSNTTGRHLAAIDGGDKLAKAQRADPDTFAAKLGDALERFGNASTTDTTRERFAAFGEEVVRELRERGQARETRAGDSRAVDGMARDGFHKLGQRARELGFFGDAEGVQS